MKSAQALEDVILPKNNLRAAGRMLLFALTLVVYFIVTIPLYPFIALGIQPVRAQLIRVLSLFCRFALWFMGIDVETRDAQKIKEEFGSGLIVCNHLSYLDVLILFAHHPACFVTSVEIKNTPFLGQLCLLAGCLFVERRSRERLSHEVASLTQALQAGQSVVIFPEATSTNGEAILRFRRPLFAAAIDAEVPLLTLVLNYQQVGEAPVTRFNRDVVCWYGEMTFLDHLWRFFQVPKTQVSLTYADLLKSVRTYDTTALAARSEQIARNHYRPIS